MQKFYLSSHDFGSDPRPRVCEKVSQVPGLRSESDYLLIRIEPALTTKFWDGPISDFDKIFLAIVGNYTEHDIGKSCVMADIVICPTYHGGTLDERACSRIGVGRLHATYADALTNSPIEEDNE
jgi:hypothetical protein